MSITEKVKTLLRREAHHITRIYENNDRIFKSGYDVSRCTIYTLITSISGECVTIEAKQHESRTDSWLKPKPKFNYCCQITVGNKKIFLGQEIYDYMKNLYEISKEDKKSLDKESIEEFLNNNIR